MSEAPTTPTRLVIERTADCRGVVLALSGELDLATAPELDRQLRNAGQTHPGRLLVDLRGLEFMDGIGLGSIIRAQRSAAASGHTLALRRGAGQVQRLFDLVGLNDRLPFEA